MNTKIKALIAMFYFLISFNGEVIKCEYKHQHGGWHVSLHECNSRYLFVYGIPKNFTIERATNFIEIKK